MYRIVPYVRSGVGRVVNSDKCEASARASGQSDSAMSDGFGDHDGIRLLDVREAARFLGTTPKTLYTMAWRRDIVFVKIGRSLRFDVRDLEQMIEKAKVRPSDSDS
jgi:excisionase family DNA binding protein